MRVCTPTMQFKRSGRLDWPAADDDEEEIHSIREENNRTTGQLLSETTTAHTHAYGQRNALYVYVFMHAVHTVWADRTHSYAPVRRQIGRGNFRAWTTVSRACMFGRRQARRRRCEPHDDSDPWLKSLSWIGCSWTETDPSRAMEANRSRLRRLRPACRNVHGGLKKLHRRRRSSLHCIFMMLIILA